MDLTSPSTLKDLFKNTDLDPTPKTTLYSPSYAVRYIDNEFSKRDYINTTTLDLLGLEEEFTSRIQWLEAKGDPIPDADRRGLDAVHKELKQHQRVMDLGIGKVREEFTRRNKWRNVYPDEGPFRRELYSKFIDMFRNGATFTERLCLAANRVGKTFSAAYEVTCHATGIYPSWWEGHRFHKPVFIWVCNKGAKEVRDINEQELLGPLGNLALRGTGMLPGHRIVKCTPKSGTPNAVEFIDIKHVSGGVSRIQSKSFDQGREAFQGTAIDFIWDDEECPEDVYGEQVMRIITTGGLILVTYTPINGLTPLTTEFLRAAGIEIEGDSPETQKELVNG